MKTGTEVKECWSYRQPCLKAGDAATARDGSLIESTEDCERGSDDRGCRKLHWELHVLCISSLRQVPYNEGMCGVFIPN